MNQKDSISAKTRGTIIVDSGILRQLAKDIPLEFQKPPVNLERSYLDILVHLGRLGFDVVIPEVVAIESAGVLKTGECLDDIFTDSAACKDSAQQATDRILSSFLKQVAAENVPGVRVEPPEPGAPSADYVRELHDAVGKIFVGRKSRFVNMPLLIDVQRKYNRHHIADDEKLDLLERKYAKAAQPGNIFLLTEDNLQLSDTFHPPIRIHELLDDFFHIVGAARFGLLGFPDTTMEKIITNVDGRPFRPGAAEILRARQYKESSFFTLLSELEEKAKTTDSMPASKTPEAEAGTPTPAISQVNKFNQRMAKTLALKSGGKQ